ncbi:MAG: hypothetical protein LBU32_19610 [Clostridiales bacterium]|nr:hypothetical protein [Clostridiales bacterium]
MFKLNAGYIFSCKEADRWVRSGACVNRAAGDAAVEIKKGCSDSPSRPATLRCRLL